MLDNLDVCGLYSKYLIHDGVLSDRFITHSEELYEICQFPTSAGSVDVEFLPANPSAYVIVFLSTTTHSFDTSIIREYGSKAI